MSLFEEGVYVFRLKGERHVQPFFIETIDFSRFFMQFFIHFGGTGR